MKLFASVVLGFPFLLTGCASLFSPASESELSCPGMPQGVICKTPTAVYKSTNEMPAPIASDLPIGMSSAPPARRAAVAPAERATTPTAIESSASSLRAARPVREPATVMRIWIAPWIDKNDDLHYPSYLFTEVQPRRWTMGKSELAGQGLPIPHKALSSVAPVPTSENSAETVPRGASRRIGDGGNPSSNAVPPLDVTLE